MTNYKKQETRLTAREIESYINHQPVDYRWRVRYVWNHCGISMFLALMVLISLGFGIDLLGFLFAWLNPGKSTVYVVSDLYWLRILSLPVAVEFIIRCVAVWRMDIVIKPCRKQAEYILDQIPPFCKKPGNISYMIACLGAVCVLLSYSSCYYFTDKAIIHTSIVPSWNWKLPYKSIYSAKVQISYDSKGRKIIECSFHQENGRHLYLSNSNPSIYSLVLNKWTGIDEPTNYVSGIINWDRFMHSDK